MNGRKPYRDQLERTIANLVYANEGVLGMLPDVHAGRVKRIKALRARIEAGDYATIPGATT